MPIQESPVLDFPALEVPRAKAHSIPHDAAARRAQALLTLILVMVVTMTVGAFSARYVCGQLHLVASQLSSAAHAG